MDARQRGRAIEGGSDPMRCHIGLRLRMARKAADLSQEKLAAKIGVTFQQVQKYEKGTSTISAARLHDVAVVLGVPVSFFFPEPKRASKRAGGTPPDDAAAALMAFLATTEGVELGKAFSEIADPNLRRRALELIRSIASIAGDSSDS